MRRLLLIDDDPVLGRLFAEYLRRAGFDVSIAAEGGEARRALEARGWDAVVLDLRIPDAAAEDLLAIIASGTDRMAVVAVSGMPPPPALDSLLAARGIPFLQKPFRPEALLRHLENPLGVDPYVIG